MAARRALVMRAVGTLLFVTVAILFVSGMLLLAALPALFPLVALCILVLAIVSIITTYLLLEQPQPERIYEMGFTETGFLGDEIFVPWAALSGWTELAHVQVGRPRRGGSAGKARRVKVTMEVRGTGDNVKRVPPGLDNAHLIRQAVRIHGARPDLAPRAYERDARDWYTKAVATALFLAVAMAIFIAGMASPMRVLLGTSRAGVLVGSLAAAPVLFWFFLQVTSKMGWSVPRGVFPHAVVAGMMGAMLLLAGLTVSHYGLEALDYDYQPYELPYPGSSLLRLGEHRSETINISEPISVIDGMSLTLDNCTVTFTQPHDEDFGIWVEEGSSLVMRNTTVRCEEGSYAIIEVHGAAWIEDCWLEYLGGEPGFSRLDGCVRVFSDRVSILDTNITYCDGDGIVTSGCSPVIHGCVLDGVWDDGIVCYGGAPLITDCFIMGAQRGIVLEGSDATVAGCEVRSAHVGISIVSASPTVERCAFHDCWGAAGNYDTLSDPHFSNISLTGNGAGLVERHWTDLGTHPLVVQFGDLCTPTLVVIYALTASMASASILRAQRRGRRLVPARRVGEGSWVEAVGPSRLEMGAPVASLSGVGGARGTSPWRNRGEVLWRAGPWRIARERLRVERPLLLAFGPMLVVMPVLFSYRPSEGVAVNLALLYGIIALTSLAFWWESVGTPRAIEVCEHGVVVASPSGRWRFVPWHSFREAIETVPSDGPRRFVMTGGRTAVAVEETSEHYEAARTYAMDRMGRRGADHRGPSDTPVGRLRADFRTLFAIALGASLTTVSIVLSDGVDSPSLSLPAAHLIVLLGLWVFLLPLLLLWLMRLFYEPGISAEARVLARRLVNGGLVVCVVFGIVFVASFTAMTEKRMEPLKDADPGTSWLQPGVYRGEVMRPEGPVVVHSGESLTLVDAELNFTYGGMDYRGIWVGKGGTLRLLNTTVRAFPPTMGFAFEVHGSAVIDGCLIIGTAEEPWLIGTYEMDSGLEVFSSDVSITNTSILHSNGNAVSVHGCSPTIRGCRMEGMQGAGIEVAEGDATIEGCWIGGGYEGISLHHSKARIRDCTILLNRVGITMRFSSPRVEGCVFENNTVAGVRFWASEGDPRLEDNVYTGDGPHRVVERRHSSPWGYLFLIYLVPVLIVGIIGGSWVWEAEGRPPPLHFILERPAIRKLLGRPARQAGGLHVVFCSTCGSRMTIADVRHPDKVRCPLCMESWTLDEQVRAR